MGAIINPSRFYLCITRHVTTPLTMCTRVVDVPLARLCPAWYEVTNWPYGSDARASRVATQAIILAPSNHEYLPSFSTGLKLGGVTCVVCHLCFVSFVLVQAVRLYFTTHESSTASPVCPQAGVHMSLRGGQQKKNIYICLWHKEPSYKKTTEGASLLFPQPFSPLSWSSNDKKGIRWPWDMA